MTTTFARTTTATDLESVDAVTRREFLAGLAAAGLLAACGDDGGDAVSATDSPEVRVVEDATGTVELPANPERIVPLDGIWAANLYSLGLAPAALPGDVKLQLSVVKDLPPGDADFADLPEVGLQYEINLEALAAADPDPDPQLRVRGRRLRRGVPGHCSHLLRRIASALGAEDRAAEVQADYQDTIDGLPDDLSGSVIAFVRAAAADDIRADTLDTSFAASVARSAGLDVLDIADRVDLEADANFVTLSEEQLDLLAGAAVIILGDISAYDPSVTPTDEILTASPLWATLPAVQAGAVVQVPGPIYNGGTYQSATALLDAIAEALG